jgi:hypothetical protein
MKSYRPFLLASTLLLAGGGCKPPPTMDADDLRDPRDLSSQRDLSSTPDLAGQDLVTVPDLAVACGYRQTYVPEQMACACNMPAGHTVSCSATFCCSAGQTCLDGDRCSSPPGRRLAAMAYDGKNFYDTVAPVGVKRRDDLWQLDAVTWGPITLGAPRPAARLAPAMAYDGARVVLFGGTVLNMMNQERPSAETWIIDGNTVTLSGGAAPPARSGHVMAFDSARSRVVMFGGLGDPALLNDTWEWNGTAWLQKTLATAPTPRENPNMAYDVKRGVSVLFGGTTAVYVYSAETWLYNGTSWARVTTLPAETPTSRSLAAMAYDANRERVVMFSGETPGERALTDMWEWDGAKWTKINAVGPIPRLGGSMIYDPVRKVVLLYGGLVDGTPRSWGNDLWSWDGVVWRQLY